MLLGLQFAELRVLKLNRNMLINADKIWLKYSAIVLKIGKIFKLHDIEIFGQNS